MVLKQIKNEKRERDREGGGKRKRTSEGERAMGGKRARETGMS